MKNIITIDGLAASGKGTLARRLAAHLNYFHLDTGKIYRVIGLMAHEKKIEPEKSISRLTNMANNLADNFDLSLLDNPDLKSDIAGQMASRISQFPDVRLAVLDLQRHIAHNPSKEFTGTVMDGRDCGTIICPDAYKKFFVTANTDIRAKRRHEELKSLGSDVSFETVLLDMQERDERDSKRDVAPTKPADDAVIIDTSAMTADQAFQVVIKKAGF